MRAPTGSAQDRHERPIDRADQRQADRLVGLCITGVAPVVVGALGLATALPLDADLPALRRPEVLSVLSLANLTVGAVLFAAVGALWVGHTLWRRGRHAMVAPALVGALAASATLSAATPFGYSAVKALLMRDFSEAYRLPLAAMMAAALGAGLAGALRRMLARGASVGPALRTLSVAAALACACAVASLYAHDAGRTAGMPSTRGAVLYWAVPGGLALLVLAVSWLAGVRQRRLTAVLAWSVSLVPALMLLLRPTVPLDAARPPIPTGSPRTVVLLTIDTLRRDVVDPYVADGGLMPNLGRLAEQSVVFDDAHAPSPWTRPSVASILTGLRPLAHGVTGTDRVLPPQVANLAEIFHQHGYATVGAGANHNLLRDFGFARGFDEYAMGSEPRGSSLGAGALKLYMRSWFTTRGITDRALDALSRAGEQPLFLWVHYLTPHIPYAPPAAYLPDAEPAGDIGVHFGDTPREDPAEVNRSQPLTPAEQRWVRALYDAEVRYADTAVGEVLDALKAAGRFDDALIAFTSDHGEEFWDHGAFEHGHAMYREVLQMPLFVRPPSTSRDKNRDGDKELPNGLPKRVQTRVSTHALFPTLLELAGLPVPQDKIDVDSLVPLLMGDTKAPAPRPHVATATLYGEPQSAVIDGDHKLILRHTTQTRELYDLANDPGETHNLAKQQPGRVQRLESLLQLAEAEAAALRDRLGMQGDSKIEMNADTVEQLRELGYIR